VAQGALAMDGLASQMMSKKLPVSNLRCFIRGSDLRRAYTRCSFMKFTPLFFCETANANIQYNISGQARQHGGPSS
jgi:hypothetical protein